MGEEERDTIRTVFLGYRAPLELDALHCMLFGLLLIPMLLVDLHPIPNLLLPHQFLLHCLYRNSSCLLFNLHISADILLGMLYTVFNECMTHNC